MMKLSVAILLGDSLKRCSARYFLTSDGSCGCALGGALLACGVDGIKFAEEHNRAFGIDPDTCLYRSHPYQAFVEMDAVKQLWPWLTREHVSTISDLYYDVQRGNIPLENIVEYVRSIEPPEYKEIPAEVMSEISEVKYK